MIATNKKKIISMFHLKFFVNDELKLFMWSLMIEGTNWQ